MKSDDQHPVAYDEKGRPLYLHPPQAPGKSAGQSHTPHDEVEVVQVTRSTDPVPVSVSPEMARRHQDSKRKYPFLNLTNGEYVVSDVDRHPVGIVFIWALTLIVCGIIAVGWWLLLVHPGMTKPVIAPESVIPVSSFAAGLIIFIGLIGWSLAIVYKGNKFFLTNESVIQEIQTSLFSKKEQTINLENIKDASFLQVSLVQQLFGYGTIKLSTEGDEQEYVFTLVSNPRKQIGVINNVVEAVKYGRPIDEAIEGIPH